MVRVVPAGDHLDFRAAEVHFYSVFTPVGRYAVTNKPLADFFIDSLFENIRGNKLFGSGFPIAPHKRASAMVLEDSFIVFDKAAP
jgi:hypothetical protein